MFINIPREYIYEDINFIANVTGTDKKGTEIVANMKNEINSIKEIGDTRSGEEMGGWEIGSTPTLFNGIANPWLQIPNLFNL